MGEGAARANSTKIKILNKNSLDINNQGFTYHQMLTGDVLRKFFSNLHAKLFGKFVGSDIYGNMYYELKIKNYWGNNKRICIFNGISEASKIPAQWHGWMHHNSDLPTTIEQVTYSWLRPHLPVLTGTKFRFLPKWHLSYSKSNDLFINKNDSTSHSIDENYYKPWKPKDN